MKEQYTTYEEKPHSIGKTALALRYNPTLRPASARRMLNIWIETNRALKRELQETDCVIPVRTLIKERN